MENVFKDARDILDDVEKFERLKPKYKPEEYELKEIRKQFYVTKRMKRLCVLTKSTYKCMQCYKTIDELGKWVIKKYKGSDIAVCRTCSKRLNDYKLKGGNGKMKRIEGVFKTVVIERVHIDGLTLATARMEAGFTREQFAERLQWSRAYQQKLENGLVKTITPQKRDLIIQVLKECGIEI
jgi:DNA-directed RNA polymerase subunit RPC12/RpoP